MVINFVLQCSKTFDLANHNELDRYHLNSSFKLVFLILF